MAQMSPGVAFVSVRAGWGCPRCPQRWLLGWFCVCEGRLEVPPVHLGCPRGVILEGSLSPGWSKDVSVPRMDQPEVSPCPRGSWMGVLVPIMGYLEVSQSLGSSSMGVPILSRVVQGCPCPQEEDLVVSLSQKDHLGAVPVPYLGVSLFQEGVPGLSLSPGGSFRGVPVSLMAHPEVSLSQKDHPGCPYAS